MLTRIEHLTAEVHSLSNRVKSLENAAAAIKPSVSIDGPPVPQAPVHPLFDSSSSTPADPAGSSTIDRRSTLETMIGGKLANRLGILILLLGSAYFLKYAFDNGWIGVQTRIIIGYLAGIAMLAAGDRLYKKNYAYFAQGLTGGAIGIFYLTTFFAYNVYHLIGRIPSFSILVLAALAGALLAHRQNAVWIAVLSIIGGFTAPFMTPGPEPNALGLLGYTAVLDLSVLLLAHYKRWRVLGILSLLGTIIVYAVYRDAVPMAADSVTLNQSFLTLYFLIFGGMSLLYSLRDSEKTRWDDLLLMLLNACAFYGFTYQNLNTRFDYLLGPIALLLAVLYLAVAQLIRVRKHNDASLFLLLLGTGLAFVTLAIPIQLDGDWITTAWLTESIVLVYAGLRADQRYIYRAGLALLGLVTLTTWSPPFSFDPLTPFANHYSANAWLAVLGLFFCTFLIFRSRSDGKLLHPGWIPLLMGILFLLKQTAWEITNGIAYWHLSLSDDFTVTIGWSVLAALILAAGLIRNKAELRYSALALFGICVFKMIFMDLSSLSMGLRVLILLIIGLLLLGVSYLYQKRERKEGAL